MKNEAPKISIIAPIRNVAKYIDEMVRSVIKQTFHDWELIIMDGASTDETISILKKYADNDHRIKIYSEKDEGPWHAVDKGLRIARGEFITIVCGQDGLYDPLWFEKCAKVFKKDKDVSLVWGVNIAMSENGQLAEGVHPTYSHLMNKEGKAQTALLLVKKIISVIKDICGADPIRRRNLLDKLFSKTALLKINHLTQRNFGESVPQKEKWFEYWLETGLVFPDQSMVIAKEVFLKCTPPYVMGSRTTGHLSEFYYNFNANGYLAHYIPIIGSFGRYHEGQSGVVANEEMHKKSEEYFEKVRQLKNNLRKNHGKIIFRSRDDKEISRKEFQEISSRTTSS